MLPRSLAALMFVALCAAPGCYTVKFNSPQAAAAPSGATVHTWTHSFFWGILPVGSASLDQCGEPGIQRMKSQIGGLGLLAYALTGGIWAPMHVKITCAAPRSADLDPAWNEAYDGVAQAPIVDVSAAPLVLADAAAE